MSHAFYMYQGLKVGNGLAVGRSNLLSPDLLTPTTILAQNGNLNMQGTINPTGNLTAPNMYTKTEIDNMLTPKATPTCVNSQLTGNKPIHNIHKVRG